VNKLVGVLAVGTLAFAGATFHLANEVRDEEQRSAQRFLRATIALPAPAQQPQPLPFSKPVDAEPRAARAPLALSPSERDAQLEVQIRAARASEGAKLLQRYEDPQEREKLLEEERAEQRRLLGRFPRMMSLTDEETNRLLDVLAQLHLEGQLKVARCVVEPRCSGPQDFSDVPMDRDEAEMRIAAVLGAETARRYDTFQNSVQERLMVTSFRARLDGALMVREEDAERLIEALADERDKYAKELEQRGGKIHRTSISGFPVLVREGSWKRIVPEVNDAVALGKRQRERASRVLSAEQMRAFDEVQDDVVSMVRERRRSLETIRTYESLWTSGSETPQ
jgi:hypothetical protein